MHACKEMEVKMKIIITTHKRGFPNLLGLLCFAAAAPGLDSHHVARFFLNPRQKKN
jgi:hypothetical protein